MASWLNHPRVKRNWPRIRDRIASMHGHHIADAIDEGLTVYAPLPPEFGARRVTSHGGVQILRDGHWFELGGHVSRGYRRYTLDDRPRGIRMWRGHRLVALAFLGDDELPMVLHSEPNRANNDIRNLRYGDAADNNSDTVEDGNHPAQRSSHWPPRRRIRHLASGTAYWRKLVRHRPDTDEDRRPLFGFIGEPDECMSA